MRYVALATDYDGTLAHDGRVAASTLEALRRLAATGRRLLLVTGRQLDDLKAVFPHFDLFDRIVAENGAVILRPETGETRTLAPPPPPALVAELEQRGVSPLSVGAVVVATFRPHETTVLETISELGLEAQVIFNKGAVMVLPAGVNKASGLLAALRELKLSPHNVVAVGDAENDHALLDAVECSAAVANSVPLLLDRADIKLERDHGAGVEELIEMIIADDLAHVPPRADREVVLGERENGESVRLPPAGWNLLLTGTSGSGKSTLATSLLEQLAERDYQFCIVDPEGDYEGLDRAIVFGGPGRAPGVDEIMTALDKPGESVVVNLLGLKLEDRPGFCATLLSRLQEIRTRAGRPHWILLDEAHHMLPAGWQPAPEILADVLESVIYVTVHPESLSEAVLNKIDVIAAIGDAPHERIRAVRSRSGKAVPAIEPVVLDKGEALVSLDESIPPFKLRIRPSRGERRRHLRKYAEGDLGPERSFYFRGPNGKLNLRAQNLALFMQIADGVDEQTWLHHLGRGDYSRWIAQSIKDADLEQEVREVERQSRRLGPAESRNAVRAAIERRYTLPAGGLPVER